MNGNSEAAVDTTQIAQHPLVAESATFQTFLLNAQKEVQQTEEEVEIKAGAKWNCLAAGCECAQVSLVNGKSALVTILSTNQTLDVLQAVWSALCGGTTHCVCDVAGDDGDWHSRRFDVLFRTLLDERPGRPRHCPPVRGRLCSPAVT